jgi:16S rRNA (guanine966-N2)-methyltransferase
MRVIAGALKNRTIFSVKGGWLRPTTDRTREFVFSWLGNLVVDSRVLDLFAGTGGLGIEAVSRGARSVTFVDSSPAAFSLLNRNTAALGIDAAIHSQDALAFLRVAARSNWRYDLIFCDPPYQYPDIGTILHQIHAGRLLDARGLFVYETGSRQQVLCPNPWQVRKVKVMGDTQILFMELRDDEENRNLPGIV